MEWSGAPASRKPRGSEPNVEGFGDKRTGVGPKLIGEVRLTGHTEPHSKSTQKVETYAFHHTFCVAYILIEAKKQHFKEFQIKFGKF